MNDDLTPEWLRHIDIKTALNHLAYDVGCLAAKLTMIQQRVNELNNALEARNEVQDDDKINDS